MSGFSEFMRLKEMAEEDIYFACRDRELIAELKRRRGGEVGKDHSAEATLPDPPDNAN